MRLMLRRHMRRRAASYDSLPNDGPPVPRAALIWATVHFGPFLSTRGWTMHLCRKQLCNARPSSRFVAAAECSRAVEMALLSSLVEGGCLGSEDSDDGDPDAADDGTASGGTHAPRQASSDDASGDDSDEQLPPGVTRPAPFDALLVEARFTHLRQHWSGVHLVETLRRRRWAVSQGLA